MKTANDLNSLIPSLTAILSDRNHQIGQIDCCGGDYEPNCLCYEEDGWMIEVSYKCCGDWEYDRDEGYFMTSAWGEVTDISASYYDEESGEERIFNHDEIKSLWTSLDEVLKSII